VAKKKKMFSDALPLDVVLHSYRIENVLGQGGFGITYAASAPKLGEFVAIKEFFPSKLVTRHSNLMVDLRSTSYQKEFEKGLKCFLEEARTLVQFRHNNVVRVRDFFEMNGTAYMVMDFEDGEHLGAFLERRRYLTEQEIIRIINDLLNALDILHSKGIIHRDIKPANIVVRKNKTPVLIDFGAARNILEQMELTVVVSLLYAPPEQFSPKGEQGPWSDIYALGAVCYEIVTGVKPVESAHRLEMSLAGNPDPMISARQLAKWRYSMPFLESIDHATMLLKKHRFQTAKAWKDCLHDPVSCLSHVYAFPGSDFSSTVNSTMMLTKVVPDGVCYGGERFLDLTFLHELPLETARAIAKSPVKGVLFPKLLSLSADVAEALAEWEGTLMQLGVCRLSEDVARMIVHWRVSELLFNQLDELSPATARILAHWCGRCIAFHKLNLLNPATAFEFASWSGFSLQLDGLTSLEPDSAKALVRWSGRTLSMRRIQELSPDIALILSEWAGERLDLSGLTALSSATARALSRWKGQVLWLSGIEALSSDAARELSRWPGTVFGLIGLTGVSSHAKRSLQQWRTQSEDRKLWANTVLFQ